MWQKVTEETSFWFSIETEFSVKLFDDRFDWYWFIILRKPLYIGGLKIFFVMIFFKEITTLQKTGETSEKICTALVYSSDDMDLGNTVSAI